MALLVAGFGILMQCGPVGPDLPRSGDEPMLRVAQLEPTTTAVAPQAELPAGLRPDIAAPDDPGSMPEPFGTPAAILTSGGMAVKWKTVQAQLPAEIALVEHCSIDEASCPDAAKSFLDVVTLGKTVEGTDRLEAINRAINLAIRPATDKEIYEVEEFWATPLQTFVAGVGDCEDYAIAKYVALKMSGVAAKDLRLVVVRDHAVNDYHAVVAVYRRDRWYILDNRTMTIRIDSDIAEFSPLFSLDDRNVRRIAPAVAQANAPGRS